MTVNREQFAKLADFFERHPEMWDQDSWGWPNDRQQMFGIIDSSGSLTPAQTIGCGMHACVAGWIAILNGYQPTLVKGYAMDIVDYSMVLPPTATYEKIGSDSLGWTYIASEMSEPVVAVAKQLLFNDHDSRENSWMFDSEAGPASGYTVASAMRAIANGENPADVWNLDYERPGDEDDD